jgi:AraC-like DNA-binding protein
MAEALLAQPSVPMSQIAHMLDYANSSAFSKSARRWFGETPRAHRSRLTAAPHAMPGRRLSQISAIEAAELAKRSH